jgi:hypothetical protein
MHTNSDIPSQFLLALATDRDSSLDYLAAVLHGRIRSFGSLDTNITVVQSMDAARDPFELVGPLS